MSAKISEAGRLYIRAGMRLERSHEWSLRAAELESEAASTRCSNGPNSRVAAKIDRKAEEYRALQKASEAEAAAEIEQAIQAETEAKGD